MKTISAVALALLFLGCGKSGDHTGHDVNGKDSLEDDPNQALYEEVMRIHDEVMPKDEDLYKLKQDLQKQIANSPNLVAEERLKLERRIAAIDSVRKMMTDWMHEFNMPETNDNEVRREYLEAEMERIEKVREATLETLKN